MVSHVRCEARREPACGGSRAMIYSIEQCSPVEVAVTFSQCTCGHRSFCSLAQAKGTANTGVRDSFGGADAANATEAYIVMKSCKAVAKEFIVVSVFWL